jgi:hypothetical protein
MTDQEKTDQNEEVVDRKAEMKKDILGHLMKIRQISDTFISLSEKNDWTPEDVDAAFDFNDGILEETDEINALLFDYRTIP